jgi:hypothetical protein
MARYKLIDTSPRFLAVDLEKQLLPGSFEYAVHYPHVHLAMPAATLDARTRRWRTKTSYLFNHQALAKVFRAKLLAALKQAGLGLPAQLPKKWVADCKSVGNGEKALVYLGRYFYRGVLRESDILACENGQVSFRYRDSQSGEIKVRTLPASTNVLTMANLQCGVRFSID